MIDRTIAMLEAEVIAAAEAHDDTAAAEKQIRAEWNSNAMRLASSDGAAFEDLRGRLAGAAVAHHEAHERVIAVVERLRAAKLGAP